jgi:UDP:flavonoid glycosyltransferase YjiC (YdhE family)
MPEASLVICHAGHGTMVRALASGATVLTVPHVGDMAENAARADWAGVGVRLPWGLLGPRPLALAVRRALERPELADAVRRLTAANPIGAGPARAADRLEALARRGRPELGSVSPSAARRPAPAA